MYISACFLKGKACHKDEGGDLAQAYVIFSFSHSMRAGSMYEEGDTRGKNVCTIRSLHSAAGCVSVVGEEEQHMELRQQ